MISPPKPTVLHIVYSGLGGIASVFFSLVEADPGSEFEQVVAFYGVEPVVPEYREHCERLGIRQRYFERRPRIDLTVNGELLSWMETVAPDTIIVHLPRALGPAIRYRRRHPGVQVIGVEHNAVTSKQTIDWVDSLRLIRQCDTVVYLTEVYRRTVAAKLRGLFVPERSVVIPNGVSLQRFHPATNEVSAAREGDARPLRFGMCTRLSKGKDLLTLLRAFKRTSDAAPQRRMTLSIAGDGPQRAELEIERRRLGLEDAIRFEGLLDEPTLADWFRTLDIYVHASVSETMSTAVMQAMATALPCVLSDVLGMDELVPRDLGRYVPVGDVEALSAALLALVEDDAARSRLGAATLEHVREHFSRELSWRRYRDLILS